MTTVLALSATATVTWAWAGGTQNLGLSARSVADPSVAERGHTRPHGQPQSALERGSTSGNLPGDDPDPDAPADPADPAGSTRCHLGRKLVPTCGVLWGVAPGAYTDTRGVAALATFEKKTQRHQDIFHAYHNGQRQLFPTETEISIAREPGKERLLFLNWKPTGVSWARIARGDPRTDAFLDRLATHINQDFPEQFFLTIYHEGEDQVRERAGSGYEAEDYAAMYRHVVLRLRAHGVHNMVTVLVHMAYVPHTSQSWFEHMYPGDDVVDWIGFDSYSYSDPGYGHGDFAELMNRRSPSKPNWPGFYNWAQRKHPGKPLMVAEWGVWGSKKHPDRRTEFYREVGRQIGEFPKIRALIAFETPHSKAGRTSCVDTTRQSLAAYRQLSHLPIFNVQIRTPLA
jgi:hypothetical protein